jgi:hypothetical protein
MTFVTSPQIGSTNWGTAVNLNWTAINNAFMTSAPFSGSVVIGTDPGGSAPLRIGGNVYTSGNLFIGPYASAPTDFPTAPANFYAAANGPGLVSYTASTGGNPATSGSTQTAAALMVRFGLDSVSLDFGVRTSGNVWMQTGLYISLGTTFPIELNPVGGPVIVGTDPGGSDLFRVGGALTISDTKLLTTKTSFTNGAASTSPTLGATGPSGATTPTKWIPVNDNGTTRYIPAW